MSQATVAMPGWGLILVVLAVALVWLGSAAAASWYGGWSSLARHYADSPARPRRSGERFRFAAALMGDDGLAVSYAGSLDVTVGDAGIGLRIGYPQRWFSPPLFIPWSAVAGVEARRTAISSDAAIRLHGRDKLIRLRGSAGQCVLETWARVGHPSD